MKLTIETALLQALVRAIKPFVAKEAGSNMPATVNLRATEGALTLTAGSNVSAVKVQRPANVELRGSTVVPAELLINLAAALPGETTLLDKDQQMLRVSSGAVHTKLTVLQEEWEPEFVHDLPGFIGSADLKDAIASVQHAAAKSFASGISRGVLIEINDDGARVVTTDNSRLALAKIEDAGGIDAKVVTPRDQATSLAKVFTDAETLKVAVDDAYIYLEGHQAMVKLSLMEGAFPDYRAIVPSQQIDKTVRVDATDLRAAVERASILTSFDDNNRMDVIVADGRVVVLGENSYGTLQESVDATVGLTAGDEPFAVAMNTRFLREALAQVKDTVLISVPGDGRPVLIAPADSDAFLAVVAPLKTTDISVDEALAQAKAEAAAVEAMVTAPGVTAQA